MGSDNQAVMNLLKRFGKAFNGGDVDGILDCVTEDFEWRLARGPDAPDGQIVRGKEAVRAALADRDRAIGHIRFSETEVIMAAGHVIGRFRATGEWASGEPIDVRGVDIYEIRDGKIAVKDSYWKSVG